MKSRRWTMKRATAYTIMKIRRILICTQYQKHLHIYECRLKNECHLILNDSDDILVY